MGFFSIFSGIVSGVSSAISAIGSSLTSFATGVANVISKTIEVLAPVASLLGSFANTLLQALGILKPNEDIAVMGDRALQAANEGITLDNYEDFDEYLEELRNFELDPEESKKNSEAAKITAGLGIGTVAMEDKFDLERGSLNGVWLLPMANGDYFTPEKIQDWLTAGRLGGDIFKYLENELSPGDAKALSKDLEAGMTDEERAELYQGLDDARDSWKELSEKVEQADIENPTRDE